MRYLLAEKIVELARFIEKAEVTTQLTDFFAAFLQDTEAEIRSISASKSADFCKFLDGATIIRKIVPALKKLSTDSFVHVRSKDGGMTCCRGVIRKFVVNYATYRGCEYD